MWCPQLGTALVRPARTLSDPRTRSPIPVLPNIKIASNEQQHNKMQQAHDAWDENEHASLFLSLAHAWEENTSSWTELHSKLSWHAWGWHEQMRQAKTMQKHIKNVTNGATDQPETTKQEMESYGSNPSQHTPMAYFWYSQVAKSQNKQVWMGWCKEYHHTINYALTSIKTSKLYILS